jgi:nitrate reductase gamma subunit
MTAVLYAVIYAALLVFGVATVVRAVGYARAPVHLRWELYPVPHEPSERLKHGGSYFEISEWWTEPRRPNLAAEVGWMAREILFLKGLWDANRPLWFRSFPFHFGLYLLAGTGGLLVVAAVGSLAAPAALAGTAGLVLRGLYRVTAVGGFALVLVGSAGLLHRRLTDPTLRTYTTPGDIFNLLFFLAALGLVALGLVARPVGSPGLLTVTIGLLTFDTGVRVEPVLAAGLFASALLVAYIPLTHMSHFVAKYFTYHAVRWDDAPLRDNGKLAAKLAEYLTYRPTWSAAHMKADGVKTWAEVAAANPAEGARK